jgi:hypothetical protein
MQATANEVDWARVSDPIRPFTSRTQTFVTPGRSYAVHAISLYEGVVFFLIVDDMDTPTFVPARLFTLDPSGMPPDWVCNASLPGGVDLVLGPDFIARDIDAYTSMIDQETDQIARFWRHVSRGPTYPPPDPNEV